jgi:glycosyltransferase involved in cell wall biosynthesis
MTSRNISLVIPVRNDQNLLNFLLYKILEQISKPFEVLIVDSSESPFEFEEKTQQSFACASINLIYIHSKPLNPGAARNLGVQRSSCELIAFLDVKTIPPANWLEDALLQITTANCMGVLGKTSYFARSHFEKRVRAATYGPKPIVTLPGSLFRKDVFTIVGSFLSNTIAGEDSDWILRARLHGLLLSTYSQTCLTYNGLVGIKFSELIKKWWRNYRACRDIPYLADHRSIYLLTINLIIIFIAMHWNGVFANWNEASNLYISHVTKIGVGLLTTIYIVYRGIYLPSRRGTSLGYLFPLEWVMVTLLGLTIDVVKLLAFFSYPFAIGKRLRYAFFRE